MSGLELAAALRKLDAAVPIILVTGDPAALDATAAARVGISRVLEKPFKLSEFTACLSSLNANHPA
jgi:CheY-like chemotaxis protein